MVDQIQEGQKRYTVVQVNDVWHILRHGTFVAAAATEFEAKSLASELNAAISSAQLAKVEMQNPSGEGCE